MKNYTKKDFLRDRVANIDSLLKQALGYLDSSPAHVDHQIVKTTLLGAQDLNRQIATRFELGIEVAGRDEG